jgi:transposase
MGATARSYAEKVGIQPNTAAKFFMRLRKLITSSLPSYELNGEVEIDESYLGSNRKGMRGRGAAGKVAIFGFFKLGVQVSTAIIPNAKT